MQEFESGFKSEVQHLPSLSGPQMPSTNARYHQLQREDRVSIASLKQQSVSVRAIARQLQRSPSTISRELQRNSGSRCQSSGYASERAQCQSLQRRRCGRPSIKLQADAILFDLVAHLLRLHWSPEQIVLTLAHLHPQRPCASRVARAHLQRHLCHTRGRVASSAYRHPASVPQQTTAQKHRQRPQRPETRHAEHPCPPARDRGSPFFWALGGRLDHGRR